MPPAIISKNNLIINSSKDKINNHKLFWSKTPNADSYELILEGINSSTILGENYFEILNTSLQDTLYNLDSTNLTNYNSFRWKLRSNVENKWSDFTDYYYFKIQSENETQPLVDKEIAEAVEELVLRLRYSSYIDEMLLAKRKRRKSICAAARSNFKIENSV
ncbi:MAG: hypothetical protein H6613_18410 [Ignavibacteriales bacterium]|nr:hypothetical protein [Ignavibacteriales bacterium]